MMTSTAVASCWRYTKSIDDDVHKHVESMKQLALGQKPDLTAVNHHHSSPAFLPPFYLFRSMYLSKTLLYLIYFHPIFEGALLKFGVM